tara:strand:+ start:1358 stop:1762 length:405 start_codon:yes stop_codon:yes gene_type:complete
MNWILQAAKLIGGPVASTAITAYQGMSNEKKAEVNNMAKKAVTSVQQTAEQGQDLMQDWSHRNMAPMQNNPNFTPPRDRTTSRTPLPNLLHVAFNPIGSLFKALHIARKMGPQPMMRPNNAKKHWFNSPQREDY